MVGARILRYPIAHRMLPPDRTNPNDRDASAARRAASWQTDPDASIERLDPRAVFEVRSVAHLLDDHRAGIRSEMAPSSKALPIAPEAATTDDVVSGAPRPSSSIALGAAPTPVPPAMPPSYAQLYPQQHAQMLPPAPLATPLPAAPRAAVRPEAIVRRQTRPETPRSAFVRGAQPVATAAGQSPAPIAERPTRGRADETVLVNALRAGRSPWLVVLVLAPLLALLGALTAWFFAAPSAPADTTRTPNVVESSRTPIAPSAAQGRLTRAAVRTSTPRAR